MINLIEKGKSVKRGSMRVGYNMQFVIARRKRQRTTRQSIMSRRTRTELSFLFLPHHQWIAAGFALVLTNSVVI
jgi:hypothetical protein